MAAYLAGTVVLLVTSVAWAQGNDTGTATMQANASGYVDLTAGGPAVLSGSVGGSIINNKAKGTPLTGLTVQLGEVGPINRNSFVKVTVPVRLRSNTDYVVALQAKPIDSGNSRAVGSSDLGFGIDNVQRSDRNVLAGSDTVATGVLGDPSNDSDAVPSTPRWDYRPGKRLSDYAESTGVLSGPRIMRPSPAAQLPGLTFDMFFTVPPQFFAPGSFSTNITLTISAP